jgi:hypothetical protein
MQSINVKQSNAAQKNLRTDHARLCRAIALARGLFRSRFDVNGERPKLALDLTATKDHILTLKAFDGLDAYDAKTLATVVALSGPNGVCLSSATRSEIGQLSRSLLDPNETSRADAIYVLTTPTALLREMGISRGKNTLTALHDSLERLSSVSLRTTSKDRLDSEGIPLMTHRSIATEGRDWLCITLAGAITGGQYARLDMDELRSIKSDAAVLLYLRLCAVIDWPTGKQTKAKDGLANSKSFKLATLTPYVWPDKSDNRSTVTVRNFRLRKALDELARLPHWIVAEYVKNSYRITRLHQPKD